MKSVRLAERPLILAIVVGFALWVILQVLARALWVVVLVLLAIILAAAMAPAVRLLRSVRLPRVGWRIPKALAVIVIYLAGGIVLALMGYVVGIALVTELLRLLEILPELGAELTRRLDQLEQATGIPGLAPSPEDVAAQVQGLTARVADAIRFVGFFVQGLIEFAFQIFLLLTLALFMVVESERIVAFWIDLFPPGRRGKVREVTIRVGDKVGYWILGQIVVASIVGTLAGIGSALLGLPYPILIGVVTALLDLAPVVGPGLMAVPAFLLGLIQSPLIAVAAALFFYALSQFDGNVLSPLVTGRAVQLSPTLIIIAVPVGLALYGAVGALIAIPVAAALQVLTSEVLLPWLHAQQGTPAEEREEPGDEQRDRPT